MLASLSTALAVPAPAGAVAAYPKPMANSGVVHPHGSSRPRSAVDHARDQGVTIAVIDTGVQANPCLTWPGPFYRIERDRRRAEMAEQTLTRRQSLGLMVREWPASIVARGAGAGFLGASPKAKILPIVADSMVSENTGIRYAVDHGARSSMTLFQYAWSRGSGDVDGLGEVAGGRGSSGFVRSSRT